MNNQRHFAVLDGMRGIAAISVVLFHFNHWLGIPWLASNAGIAVDFFFCLSGYVLCSAYRPKLQTGMSFMAFARVRVIRLMPLILIGTALSALYLVGKATLLRDATIKPSEIALATLLGMFCLPFSRADHAIGGPQVFPLNGPQYTLFLELIANIAWPLARRLDALLPAFLVVVLCYSLTAKFGMGGDTAGTFLSGFPRVFGAYYLGVLLYHLQKNSNWFSHKVWTWLFIPASIATVALMWQPSELPLLAQWLWCLSAMPILVLGGSLTAVSGRVRRISLLLGEVSYPVYALHYPLFVWINGIFQQLVHHKEPVVEAVLFAPLILIVSYLTLRFVDIPARKWLAQRLDTHKLDVPAKSSSTVTSIDQMTEATPNG